MNWFYCIPLLYLLCYYKGMQSNQFIKKQYPTDYAYFKWKKHMFVAEISRSLVDINIEKTYSTHMAVQPVLHNKVVLLDIWNKLHSLLEKRIIERKRVRQYFKERTECYDDDDYSPYIIIKREIVKLDVYYWIKLFIYLNKAKNTRTILIQIWSSNSLNLTEPF